MSSSATPDEHGAPRAHLLRFGIVGLLATGIYLLCTKLLQLYAGAPVAVAASVSFVIVVAMNYVLHYSWTFRSTQPHAVALPRFLIVSTGGLIINYLVVLLGSRWFAQGEILVLLMGVAAVVGWNYLLSRFWVFFDHRRKG
jgi:putative flippase GtrA